MQKQRLMKLHDLLLKNAANPKGARFSLQRWVDSQNPKPDLTCNTTACAVGLGAISGIFKRQGLGYKSEFGQISITLKGYRPKTTIFGRSASFLVAMRFFGLTDAQASYLFIASSYQRDDLPTLGAEGERAVAERIQEFVKDNRGNA